VIEGQELPVPKKYLEWSPEELEGVKLKNKQFYVNMTPDQRWRRREKAKSREINYTAKLKLKGEKL